MSETFYISTTALLIAAEDETPRTVTNGAGGTLYYKTTSDVSTTNYDGTLAVGSTVSLTHPTWFISTVNTRLTVGERVPGDKGFINHGSDANAVRPTGYASVEWVGSVEPLLALNGDTWISTA